VTSTDLTPDLISTIVENETAVTSDDAADHAATIDTLRGQIDALDTAISRLVAERAQLSSRIQTARINAGGTRIELGRERAILDHYRTALGTEGAAVGEAVLRACRGAR
jgi:chorismate mutase